MISDQKLAEIRRELERQEHAWNELLSEGAELTGLTLAIESDTFDDLQHLATSLVASRRPQPSPHAIRM